MNRIITFLYSCIIIFTLSAEIQSVSSNKDVLIPTVILLDSTSYINEGTEIYPNYLFVPIIFENQRIVNSDIKVDSFRRNTNELKLDVDSEWLKNAMNKDNFALYHINRVIYQTPDLVKYNVSMLPEPPKQYIISSDPSKITMSLEELTIKNKNVEGPLAPEIKPKKWIFGSNGSVQFSQAYISDNWYQGGNNNLNLMGNFILNIKLNSNVYPKLMFENTIQYKLSLNSAPQDSLRSYSISEDLFQINSKFGVKAAKNWYYSATLQFKTQFFNSYTVNTKDLKSAFLTPGELNVGLGMSYNVSNKPKTATLGLSIAPISYNMKICKLNDKVSPESVGVPAGKTIGSQVGSNVEAIFRWNLHTNISLTSRLFMFTDYKYAQGDWENTFTFSINKYLSTQLYLHLRYDSSSEIDTSWKHWMLKEILSFGFAYKI